MSIDFRAQGLGTRLLMDALYRTLRLSKDIASAGIVVDAKDERAISFYEKYGFLKLPQVQGRLFMPMGTIEKMFR